MTRGRPILMPNTLDFGVDDSLDLRQVPPSAAIERAAQLQHWAAENAKTTRALLKRVAQLTPLAQPLQAVQITELPRPPGARRSGRQRRLGRCWRRPTPGTTWACCPKPACRRLPTRAPALLRWPMRKAWRWW